MTNRYPVPPAFLCQCGNIFFVWFSGLANVRPWYSAFLQGCLDSSTGGDTRGLVNRVALRSQPVRHEWCAYLTARIEWKSARFSGTAWLRQRTSTITVQVSDPTAYADPMGTIWATNWPSRAEPYCSQRAISAITPTSRCTHWRLGLDMSRASCFQAGPSEWRWVMMGRQVCESSWGNWSCIWRFGRHRRYQ